MKKSICSVVLLVCAMVMLPLGVFAGGPDGYRPQLPKAAFKKQKAMKSLPEPRLCRATSTVNLHLTGIDSGTDYGIPTIYIVNPFTENGQQVEPVEKEPGMLQFRFEQYATQKVGLSVNGRSIVIVLHPGETVDVWLDIAAMNLKMAQADQLPSMKYVYITGELADINLAHAYHPHTLMKQPPSFPQLLYGFDFTDMTVESYLRQLIARVKAGMDEIGTKNPSLSGAAKESMVMDLKTLALTAIKEMKILLVVRGYNGRQKPEITFENDALPLGLLGELELNDPKLIYGKDFSSIGAIAKAAAAAGVADKMANSSSGWVQDAATVFPLLAKAESMQTLTTEEEKTLASASDYYRDLYAYLKKKTDDQYAGAMDAGSFAVRDTPEHDEAGDVLDAIVAQYKGSVVFVDFWATWCGPCMDAMRTIRPLKPEMKEHGVVSVYITTESSPKLNWEMSLAGIGGEHYYLLQKEWDALLKKYDFKAIPTYMIFDKTGKLVYKKTGFPGADKLHDEFWKVW